MNKILNLESAIKTAKKLRKQNNSIVLAGGCFDIIHTGHVMFLENARKYGNVLFVFLESDEAVRKLKGNNRPINFQKNRALVLAALSAVDYVIMLPNLKTDREYDEVILKIRPSIIATTAYDPNLEHKKRQAKLINGKVIYVIKKIYDHSTSKLASLLKSETL